MTAAENKLRPDPRTSARVQRRAARLSSSASAAAAAGFPAAAASVQAAAWMAREGSRKSRVARAGTVAPARAVAAASAAALAVGGSVAVGRGTGRRGDGAGHWAGRLAGLRRLRVAKMVGGPRASEPATAPHRATSRESGAAGRVCCRGRRGRCRRSRGDLAAGLRLGGGSPRAIGGAAREPQGGAQDQDPSGVARRPRGARGVRLGLGGKLLEAPRLQRRLGRPHPGRRQCWQRRGRAPERHGEPELAGHAGADHCSAG
mmetsp:Transcript_63326/g.205571  ORF Transcript_63326/g.205571 Transcript_63326/m.205571 type:complete len:260 (+) Transcript_63326:395-1174(+)